jgi:hypothetical protein
MDNPTTLLVSIMFITILSIGVANLLTALADIVCGKTLPLPDKVHISWMLVLLFYTLTYFWQTTVILEISDWSFLRYLGIIIGPIVLFFATNLIIALPENEDIIDRRDLYMQESRRFFLLLALVPIWVVLLDVFYDSTGLETWLNCFIAALFAFLAVSKNYLVHQACAIAAWLVILVSVSLQAI